MKLALGQSGAHNPACTEEELSFLHAVDYNDVVAVRLLMAENPKLNIDVIDALGRTALRLAVRNENTELVEMLIEVSRADNIQEAVLQAISENHTSIAELMLKHPIYLQLCHKRRRLGDTDGFFKMEVESQFSSDITPLNLAAQKNNYAIVKLLLQRGERIQKPDKFDCSCMECRNRMKFDQLRMANFRLNAYRGLASEAYISLSSDDPFFTAFQLSKELRKLSYDEIHFKKEYRDLANRLSDYAVKLLDRVWTQQELEVILNSKDTADTGRFQNLIQLKLALKNKEKKFVAHSSVQQYLGKIWWSGLHKLDTRPLYSRLPLLALLSLLYPLVALLHIVKPGWKWSRLADQPMVKFLGHILSFFSFLLLIIVSSRESEAKVSSAITLRSQYPEISTQYQQYRQHLGSDAVPYGEDFPLRLQQMTIIQSILYVWIFGMVVHELQKITVTGAMAHFNDLFNVTDFLLLFVYIATLVIFRLTMNKSVQAVQALQGRNVTVWLTNREETDLHLYWLNTDRSVWTETDPTNVAEGMFAVANIVSFTRIFYLLPANETLGPMQISLRRMINDIIKLLMFATFALGGFIVSLRNLFWWYSGMMDKDGGPKPGVTNSATSFYDLRSQFITVFWWIYGRGPMNQALDVPKEYSNSEITEDVAHLLAALYHITIIIVLINLLIAMMARSFEKIVGDVDAEWKYARSLLYMEYISDSCAPAVPLNMLQPLRDVIAFIISRLRHGGQDQPDPNPADIVRDKRRQAYHGSLLFRKVPQTGRDKAKPESKGGPRCKRSLTSPPSAEEPTYTDVVQTIVKRYMFDIQREEENNTGKADESRQIISQTKWELLDQMNKQDSSMGQLNTRLQALSSEVSTLVPISAKAKRSKFVKNC